MTKLKLDKFKNWKIWLTIGTIFSALYQAMRYGQNKQKFKQNKQTLKTIKQSKETDETLKNATPDELSKLL